ncbi:glycosyltransferase family 2 protein [Bifidobacterium pullorum]|uniref:glycosyltransferase family 2 protein n=1 Tax=Bifidobacterium pullorum TaxID=78448 RepID=UPI0025A385AB|nr:glycosyltransferase family 2 protein [Bifidobacterium pullorum]MDM8322788.1 glycosyltransferase family 2 protein [Bifidobacterium pullorum]
MPVFSIIIPAYNNSRYLPDCIRSLAEQDFRDIEIIIVDDASTDDTYATMMNLAQYDGRIIPLRHETNSGTLIARRTGVSEARGSYILFVDQDDELADGTLTALHRVVMERPADIIHYGVRVMASNPAAQQAAAGMMSFLNPRPRTLHGTDILRTQFTQDGNFDWHIHHKLFAADIVKRAYAFTPDDRLLVADDFYLCFLIDSLAKTYVAVPDSPWYLYHLGRGDTFGRSLTVEKLERFAQWDAAALRLIREFVSKQRSTIARDDWEDRLTDARDRLIEHTMNEWKDNLDAADKTAGLSAILRYWSADAVCGELYRYVRDYGYAYLVSTDRRSDQSVADVKQAKRYLQAAQALERRHPDADYDRNRHYIQLRNIAYQHLRDAGALDAGGSAERPRSPLRRILHAFRSGRRGSVD